MHPQRLAPALHAGGAAWFACTRCPARATAWCAVRVTRASPASVVRSFGSADGAGARVHWSGDGGNGVAVAGDNCRCL